jgi:D-glycero-beta-D-manno-heptose-7-phosphate kinase
MANLADQLARMGEGRILVVGDVVLDEYLHGIPTRLSREAPVPVLEWERRTSIPGGAANPAQNIAAFPAEVVVASVVGDDPEGRQLIELLTSSGVDPAAILTDPSRPTTVKTRIVAGGASRLPQQIARIDRISRLPITPRIVASLAALIGDHAGTIEAILCSDYLSGLLTPELVGMVKDIAREHGVLVTVDAQGELDKYAGVDLLRCNDDEACRFLHQSLVTEDDFERGLAKLCDDLDVRLMVVTRGGDGVSLLGQGVPYTHLAAHRVEVADVTGAGDTFIALMTLALAARLDAVEAATLANTAAALVVRRIGNAVVTADELWAAMQQDAREDA